MSSLASTEMVLSIADTLCVRLGAGHFAELQIDTPLSGFLRVTKHGLSSFTGLSDSGGASLLLLERSIGRTTSRMGEAEDRMATTATSDGYRSSAWSIR